MKKKPTAVEHLIAYLSKMGYYREIPEEIIDQSYQMEKEQMFAYTRLRSIIGKLTEDYYTEDFEKFYNETYSTKHSR